MFSHYRFFFFYSLIFTCAIALCVFSNRVAHAAEVLLDINHAAPAMLAEKLPGIGPAKAKAIVLYRELHGPFNSLDELINVKGIGERTLEKIRPLLRVGPGGPSRMGGVATDETTPSQVKLEADVVRAVRAAVNVARRYRTD